MLRRGGLAGRLAGRWGYSGWYGTPTLLQQALDLILIDRLSSVVHRIPFLLLAVSLRETATMAGRGLGSLFEKRKIAEDHRLEICLAKGPVSFL